MALSDIFSNLQILVRWLHVLLGILWIGNLYFFNFVNGPFAGTLDADSKKKVVPELMPRALYWFRWGAAWTWVTGVLLLALLFYHGGLTFEEGAGEWNLMAGIMILLTFLSPFIYDKLAKSGLAKKKQPFVAIGFVLIAVISALMARCAHFSYRSYNIHMGTLFGTIMAYNVWFRIWPAQQKIISAVKNGEAPNPDLVAMAGGRSRHNTYLSVPLLWAMMNQHSTYFAGGAFGLTEESAWVVFPIVVLIGWHIVWHCYRRAGRVKGF